jgi:hypothetical protein
MVLLVYVALGLCFGVVCCYFFTLGLVYFGVGLCCCWFMFLIFYVVSVRWFMLILVYVVGLC